MSLVLAFHGGKCCGIKTIYGFGWYAYEKQSKTCESALAVRAKVDNDANGQHVESYTNFFTDSAPSESTLDRLDRYIEFLKVRRPQGVVEIALAENPDPDECHSQIKLWHDDLIKRGFKVTVPKFRNSNSGNDCQIYHLVYDEGAPPEDEDYDY